MSFFPTIINGLQVTHSTPQDGSAAYLSNVTITASGFPFTVDDGNCTVASILYKDSATSTWTLLSNGVNGVSITAASNIITVAGAGTPFASGDVYFISISYQEKAYTKTTQSKAVGERDPITEFYINNAIEADTTNVSAATHYYPSATGGTMDGGKDLSVDGKLIDADGTLTAYLEVTNDEDASGADWKKAYGYDDINNSVVNQFTVTNGTVEFAISFNNNNYRRFRWVVVASGATNTVIAKGRVKGV